MSATVKLSSKLPGDPETNGLDHLAEQMCRDDEAILCFAWIKPTDVRRNLETLEEIPTVQLARIEPIGRVSGTEAGKYTQDVADRYEKRTGRNPLPIDQLLAPKGDVDELRVADAVAELQLARPVSPSADVFVFEAPEDADYGDE